MTISPPANVRLGENEPARVLCCGLDTLYLSYYVTWHADLLLKLLEATKTAATDSGECAASVLPVAGGPPYVFTVEPYGMKGYEWLVRSREFRMDVGAWKKPKSRPSPLTRIGSESLWLNGPDGMSDRIRRILISGGAEIEGDKVTRADLCVDVLLRESSFAIDLAELFITRAQKINHHHYNGILSGISIGAGAISCRLYDKPLEIKVKSGKTFFYEVWGIDAVPEGHRIIRVEYELHREALKELGVDTFADLRSNEAAIWRYCTENWLKVCDHPERHSARRHALPWWEVVQAGYTGAQDANPAVRSKAIHRDRELIARATFGYLSSFAALAGQDKDLEAFGMVTTRESLRRLFHEFHSLGLSDEQFSEAVQKKVAKYRIPGEERSWHGDRSGGMFDVPF